TASHHQPAWHDALCEVVVSTDDGSDGLVSDRLMLLPSLTGEEALNVAVGATLLIVTLAVYSVTPPSLSLIFPFTALEPLSLVESVDELGVGKDWRHVRS